MSGRDVSVLLSNQLWADTTRMWQGKLRSYSVTKARYPQLSSATSNFHFKALCNDHNTIYTKQHDWFSSLTVLWTRFAQIHWAGDTLAWECLNVRRGTSEGNYPASEGKILTNLWLTNLSWHSPRSSWQSSSQYAPVQAQDDKSSTNLIQARAVRLIIYVVG